MLAQVIKVAAGGGDVNGRNSAARNSWSRLA